MLGYSFSVYLETEYKKFGGHWSKFPKGIASWEAGLGGTDWLEALVREGKAKVIPQGEVLLETYAVAAEVLLPIIRSGIPNPKNPVVIGDDYIMPADWLSNVTLNEEKISSISNDTELIVDAWDMS